MTIHPLRLATALLSCALLAAVAAPVHAGALAPAITVKANVQNRPGNPVTIGSINATMAYPYAETGTFTFAGGYGALDQTYNYQFRWFQIIKTSPAAVKNADSSLYRDAAGNYNTKPVDPFVDPPAGGYKYQIAGGGADKDPFYENSDPGVYAYPNYSARHVTGVSSSTDDAPGPADVFFQTYLVVAAGTIPANTFDVLGGYSWDTSLNADGTALKNPDPVAIPLAGLDLTPLQNAINGSGFTAAGFGGTAWTAAVLGDGVLVPEPSTFLLGAVGLIGLAGYVRRKRVDHNN